MKHLFCINPAAGKRDATQSYRQQIDACCQGLDHGIFISGAPGEITQAVAKCAASGEAFRVYACGGDGTLNEVVNGAAGFENVAVTHWPGGSGNDFIRMFDRPDRFRDLSQLLDADTAEFDLIRVNDRWCVGVASIGIDARIGTEIARYKRLPLVTGPGAYTISVLVNMVKGVHQHYVVELDGEVVDGRQSLMCVCNGHWYGGGYNPVPEALPDDGVLDVLLVKAVSRLRAAQIIGKYKLGRYADYPETITHYRCKTVTVTCDKPNAINLDGELLTAEKATFSLVPGALRFFYPKGASYGRPAAEAPGAEA